MVRLIVWRVCWVGCASIPWSDFRLSGPLVVAPHKRQHEEDKDVQDRKDANSYFAAHFFFILEKRV